MPKRIKEPPSSPIDFDVEDVPKDCTPEERRRILAIIQAPSEVTHDNSAMLGQIANKKFTRADRIQTLFTQQNFSPITRLVRLCKIEESKMEAWNRALEMGLEPRLMEFLPKPDKKFYATILLQLVRFEIPELKAVELTGEVQSGMKVTIQKHVPMQRLIKIDGASPEKLKLLHGSSEEVLVEATKTINVEVVDEDDI